MSPMLPRELRAKWKSDIDSFFEDRKRALENEHQKALEDFDRWWAEDAENGTGSPSVSSAARGTPAVSQQHDAAAAPNGSFDTLSARQMVEQVLPNLEDTEFTQRIVRDTVVAWWPEADNDHLASRIARVLKEMADTGILSRRREGNKIADPFIYRVKQDREASLLGP